MGLLLAAIGIYGVMSCVVAQRTHEIGLRMALGAGRARILRHIVSEAMITAAIGTVFGSLGAFDAVRSMRGIVPGIDDMEPGAFAGHRHAAWRCAGRLCRARGARRAGRSDEGVAGRVTGLGTRDCGLGLVSGSGTGAALACYCA